MVNIRSRISSGVLRVFISGVILLLAARNVDAAIIYQGDKYDGFWKGSAYPSPGCPVGTFKINISGPNITGELRFITIHEGVNVSNVYGTIYNDGTLKLQYSPKTHHARKSRAEGTISENRIRAYDDGRGCDYEISVKRKG